MDSNAERPDSPKLRTYISGIAHRIKPAVLLFFLSPLFGEYLLGNLKFTELYLLPFVAAFLIVSSTWANHSTWATVHRLALAGGGTLTYAWLGLMMTPETGPRSTLEHIGSIVIVLVAIGVFLVALKRVRTAENS